MSENEIKKPSIVKFLDKVEVKSFDLNQENVNNRIIEPLTAQKNIQNSKGGERE